MPVELSVGPAVLTINYGSTFMVTDLNGEITAETEQGVFAGDTRFVSYYAISANGEPWLRLTSSPSTYYAERIYLTNPRFATEDGEIPEETLALILSRTVRDGIHEDLQVTNHGQSTVHFNLEIALRSDFADLFEVKSHGFVRRGHIETIWDAAAGELRTTYANRDFRRQFIYRPVGSGSRPLYANGRVTFEIVLDPQATWATCCFYILGHDESAAAPEQSYYHTELGRAPDRALALWESRTTTLTSSNEDIYRLYQQSLEDLSALRLYEEDLAPDVWLPAAGVPWFVGIFGRDSLIVSLQNMITEPHFALGALTKLAQYQAKEIDEFRDAEPGKIMHELRTGELAHFRLIPHTPYYGTADATILYLIVLHEAWKWTGDDQLLRDHYDVALRCLSWIDNYGDLDGDGFQEYRTRSPKGYENMGWKDAGDAVVYPDGSQVKQPKALCELQGYVFDAWLRMAEVFQKLNEPARAAELISKAGQLQARFEAQFWCDDIGFYAFGLDPDKRPIKTVASNAGHLLWSGIASPDHAARVVGRLMEPDMWSGWGIRTLSSLNPAYNPHSYQRGSVWPHDNGIIALGFKRYGFADEAARIARDLSEAASYFVSYRLPELYAGIERRQGMFPVQYREANVPQAWAAGTVFHFLQAILGLQADAPNGRLYVDPRLPRWLPDVVLRRLDVGVARLDVRFWRTGDESFWEVLDCAGDLEVQQKSWQPWRLSGPSA